MRIDGFEIGEVVRRTSAATVYNARQKSLDRQVRIKVMTPEAAADPEVRAEFDAQSRRLAGLLHPHIVSGLLFGDVEGRPYLVLEHVEGRTLEGLVMEDGPLAEEKALRIALQIAQAFVFLENNRRVHAGLAPGAIIITEDDIAKLGNMTHVQKSGWAGRDAQDRPVGIVGYMSPEQATGAGALDARANIYTLGALLFFALSGHSPVEDATAEVVDGKVVERPPDLRAYRSDLGRATLNLVNGLLSPDPDTRPASASEVLDLVESGLKEAGQRTRVKHRKGAARRSRVRRVRRRPR
jgi:serine/threonine protein kinase